MNDWQKTSTEELEQMIRETEQCLGDIRLELERRRQQAQHEAIDKLEVYLRESEVNWSDVKAFFQSVLQELRR
jgi:hypothetical protein